MILLGIVICLVIVIVSHDILKGKELSYLTEKEKLQLEEFKRKREREQAYEKNRFF